MPPAAGPVGHRPPELRPGHDADAALLAHVRPPQWQNPTPPGRYNLVVLGGGSAGLVAAIGGAALGARVALVERDRLGGECLNTGCVPSKALLASARAAALCREAAAFGVRLTGEVRVDFAAVMARVRDRQLAIAPHDAAETLRAQGVDVYFGQARFVAPDAVAVDDRRLRFARAVIATGSRPVVPDDLPVHGQAPLLTTDTIFDLHRLPARLVVIGGGPAGCELGQAFARLGSAVTIIERGPRLLARDDPDASARLARRLAAEGVRVFTGAQVTRLEGRGPGAPVLVQVQLQERQETSTADAVLVATGRRPDVEGLDPAAAGVAVRPDGGGVQVDHRLRTTNRRVYAAGDVCGGLQLSHAADATARLVLRNALFFGRRKAGDLVIPWCTYTDPEVAHVGSGAAAAARAGAHAIEVPLEEIDRAVVDGESDGFLRVHHRRGRILGATAVGPRAGELIASVTQAITAGVSLGAIAESVAPYPTHAEALRRAADRYRQTLLTPGLARWLARFLAWRR